MTSDSGVAKQYSDDARQIQEILDELQHMQETPRLVTGLEERRNNYQKISITVLIARL